MNKTMQNNYNDYSDYTNYYYLLYKLRNSSTFWIVDESIYKKDLLERIKNFNSKKEIYYIVSKKYSIEYIKDKLDSKFIRFEKFKIDSNCKLLHNTE